MESITSLPKPYTIYSMLKKYGNHFNNLPMDCDRIVGVGLFGGEAGILPF